MMSKKLNFILLIGIMFALLVSCRNSEMEVIEEELGTFSFGFSWDEMIELEYNGEYVRIPHFVEGFAQTIDSEFGWFLYVDGLPQETWLENVDGELFREKSFMHTFSLAYRERYDFYVVFSPISGEYGSSTSATSAAILRPSFISNNIDYPIFDPFHNLSYSVQGEVRINYPINNRLSENVNVELESITQEVINAEEERLGEGNLEDFLKSFRRVSILPYGHDFELHYEGSITVEDGNASFIFLAYGGCESLNHITFFVNHEPVQINGYDFIEVQMEHEKMVMIEVSMTFDNLEAFNSLYAIMAIPNITESLETMHKTTTLLLINK